MNESFEKEMNRGFIQLLVLVVLEQPLYGYMILKELTGQGYPVEESSLYPLLRRLESKNFLESTWEVEENNPRKYYVVTREGRKLREQLLAVWKTQSRVLENLTGGLHDD